MKKLLLLTLGAIFFALNTQAQEGDTFNISEKSEYYSNLNEVSDVSHDKSFTVYLSTENTEPDNSENPYLIYNIMYAKRGQRDKILVRGSKDYSDMRTAVGYKEPFMIPEILALKISSDDSRVYFEINPGIVFYYSLIDNKLHFFANGFLIDTEGQNVIVEVQGYFPEGGRWGQRTLFDKTGKMIKTLGPKTR